MNQSWREIVGVVQDLGLSAGDADMAAGYYVPMRDETAFTRRCVSLHERMFRPCRLARLSRGVDPRIYVRDVTPLEAVGAEDRAIFAGIGMALTALGGLALLLSVIGVYAMLSFSVTQRTRELAIRAALGATRRQVLASVLGRACVPLASGALAGPLLAIPLVAARGIFAFRLPADGGPWAIPALCAIMVAAGFAASSVPGLRALRVNMSEALRR